MNNDAANEMKTFIAVLLLFAAAATRAAEAEGQIASQGNANIISQRPNLPTATRTYDVDYGTFEAPDDFTFRHTGTIDSYMGTLTRTSDGFTIHFDIGLMAGTRVTWMKQNRFTLFRLHAVSGNFAYTGIERVDGKRTIATTICDWCERTRRFLEESEAIRGLPNGQRDEKYRDLNERMARYGKERSSPANFWADVSRDEDLMEFMLIVDSYRPKVMSTLPMIIGDVAALREPTGMSP